MKKLLPVLILGSALSACAATSGYNDSHDNRLKYSGDEYVEYQGEIVRKTPTYIECSHNDRNNQLIGAGVGAFFGGVNVNEVEGGGAASGIAIANINCGEYLAARYRVPPHDPYSAKLHPGTVMPVYFHNTAAGESRTD